MRRENYGIDAPTAVRNMALGSLVCAVLWAASLFPQAGVLHDLGPIFQGPCIGLIVGTSWMLASSLWLKHIVRDRLLDSRKWRGDEQALDVGCGRGLVAVGIARRLAPQGRVCGLDLWQAVDLSGNTPERALANAAAAGVTDKVTIDSGDMRAMPYPDEAFDVIASMTAIHNIPDRQGRLQGDQRDLARHQARRRDLDLRHSPRPLIRDAAPGPRRTSQADRTHHSLGPTRLAVLSQEASLTAIGHQRKDE